MITERLEPAFVKPTECRSMGLIGELNYEVKETNALQRVTQRVAASGPGAWAFQRTLYSNEPIDGLTAT